MGGYEEVSGLFAGRSVVELFFYIRRGILLYDLAVCVLVGVGVMGVVGTRGDDDIGRWVFG
jgi:hypothetical protein